MSQRVEIKKPESANAKANTQESANAQASDQTSQRTQDLGVKEGSTLAAALQAELGTVKRVSSYRVGLRAAAQAYFASNFNDACLPKDARLHSAVKELALAMRQGEKSVWGDVYVEPGQADVTTLNLKPSEEQGLYFAAPTVTLQLEGAQQ